MSPTNEHYHHHHNNNNNNNNTGQSFKNGSEIQIMNKKHKEKIHFQIEKYILHTHTY